MYQWAHEKCIIVCFLILVMVAFLSCCCSGFRIDSPFASDLKQEQQRRTMTTPMPMPRRVQDTNSSSRGSARAIVNDGGATSAYSSAVVRQRTRRFQDVRQRRMRHRLRHTKKQPAKFHDEHATSHIDVYVRMPEEKLVQEQDNGRVPQTPAAAYAMPRSQRSPAHHRNHAPGRGGPQQQQQGGRRAKPCQEQDIARKAFMANTVVLAKAESMSANRIRNYSVSFRVLRTYKMPAEGVDDILRLTFINDSKRMHCESELFGGELGVVKAQIRQSKDYYLFLDSQFNHNYTVVGAPVLNRKKRQPDIERALANVTRRDFEPWLKKPQVDIVGRPEARSKVRLICKAKGYPIPVIKWKRNETFLHSSNNIKITYRGKKSTLVIRSMEERDSGWYTCVTRGVNRREEKESTELRIPNKEKCEDNLFCLNGGICKYTSTLKERYCICSEGYTGSRCMSKTVGVGDYQQSSVTYDDE